MSAKHLVHLILIWATLLISGCSAQPSVAPESTSIPTASPATTLPSTSTSLPEPTSTSPSLPDLTLTPTSLHEPKPTNGTAALPYPHKFIDHETMFDYIGDLTNVQPYSGWRSSGSAGEAEGLDYAAATLAGFTYLQSLGLELERQSFHVFLATEIWDSRLYLIINGVESEVPANAINGHRLDIKQAVRFDSDGALNDSDPNPSEVNGTAIVLQTTDEVLDLVPDEVQGRIVFLDFAAMDPMTAGEGVAAELVTEIIEKEATGLVLVTSFEHGKSIGDGTIYDGIVTEGVIPMLYVRLEDLATVGIDSWEALEQIEGARLIWDTDIFSPGFSGNLVARIPGADSSQSVILGAHIDSQNAPGASDNALNVAVLLEMARVLDQGRIQPPADVYLVFFGSEEQGFYGSQHFVNTHQELLDRTLAAFLLDGYTADVPGPTILAMQESSYVRFGDKRLPFSDYLTQKAQLYGIPIEFVVDSPVFGSDDGPFYGFVPDVRFAFGSNKIGNTFHSPYDDLDIVQDQGEVMAQSVSMALIAALETPQDAPDLRVTSEPERLAVIVTTHCEPLHMSPTMFINLDRALAWEGFDVDVIPYGQSFTPDDLADADLVLVLPVVDYPTIDPDLALYDEEWTAAEIDLLKDYVEGGGFLVLTNSANRLFFGQVMDANEDWDKVNALAEPFGISYENVPFTVTAAPITADNPLTEKLKGLRLIANNGLPINLQRGEVLAALGDQAVLVLVDYGEAGGQVLVLSDLGSLDLHNRKENEKDNFTFLRNLAIYARDR